MRKLVYALVGVMALSGHAMYQVAVAADKSAEPPAEADNTGRNERDQNESSVTPMDQSNSKADLETTRKIRDAVVEDDALSVNAHNVKIITVDGKVTLRGPVNTEEEHSKIVTVAKKVAGPNNVKDQLELAGR